jgi:hypothetical protein
VYLHPQVIDSSNILQQRDTVVKTPAAKQITEPAYDDTAVGYFPVSTGELIQVPSPVVEVTGSSKTDTKPKVSGKIDVKPAMWNFNTNFFIENGLQGIVSGTRTQAERDFTHLHSTVTKPGFIELRQRKSETYDWLLGIFLLMTLFFIWIRIYYSKFFMTLANALVSFQISAKMFRGKNVLHRRVSIVLDFIYLVVLSVFIFELATHFNIVKLEMSRFNLFLVFLNIIMLVTLFRIFVLRFTGYLFVNQSLFNEYIHNTFVVNKGIGIALFPVIIAAHYFPPTMITEILMIGTVILLLAFILKAIRAYQIIIRKDILIFYLILYLCTLEILPLLLGYKIIISLI